MYNEMMDTIGLVNTVDPELAAAMDRELNRQRQNIELIASENIVSPAVMAAMAMVFRAVAVRPFVRVMESAPERRLPPRRPRAPTAAWPEKPC